MNLTAFENLLIQKKFDETLDLLKSDSEYFFLNEGVTFDCNLERTKFNKINRLLPKNENCYFAFLDFIEYLFDDKKERNIAYNLLKGLLNKFPEDLNANFIFGRINIDLNVLLVAEKHILKVISLDPNSADARINFGVILFKKGDSEGAMAEFLKALQLKPDIPMANFWLAKIYRQFNQYKSADFHFRRELEVNPEYLWAFIKYAEFLLLDQKDKKHFKQISKEIESRFPNHPFLNYLYFLKYHKKRRKKAFLYHQKLFDYCRQELIIPMIGVSIDPKRDLKNYEKTIDSFLREFKDNPNDLNEKAWILIWKNELNDAEKYVKKALEIAPRFIPAKKNYLIILLLKNRIEDAKKLCDELLEISPNSFSPRLYLAYINILQDNIQQAHSILNDVIKINDKIVEANFLLAQISFQQKRYREAETYAQKSISSEYGYEYYDLFYGKILFRNRKYKESEGMLNSFLIKSQKLKRFYNSEISEAYYFISNIYLKIKEYKRAKKYIKKANKYKKDKRYYNDLAVMLIRLGKFIKAKLYLEKSLKLDKFYKHSLINKSQLENTLKKIYRKYYLIFFFLLIAIVTLIKKFYKITIIMIAFVTFLLVSKRPRITLGSEIKIIKLEISDEFDFSINRDKIPLILSIYDDIEQGSVNNVD